MCSHKDDLEPKKLFFINGTAKGEYDSEIPGSYFETPPPQLSGSEKGFEGLRVCDGNALAGSVLIVLLPKVSVFVLDPPQRHDVC